MKNQPTRSHVTVLKQLLNHISRGTVNRLARETGAEGKARTFKPFSHLSAMLFAQLSHAIGLNDVCDWLRLKQGVLERMGVSVPSRNALSHANKVRPSEFIERLFWEVLGDLQNQCPSFARRGHDNKRARELCAGLASGEVVVFDKAYIDFKHLGDLDARGVWWVTRAKDNLNYHVRKNLTRGKEGIVKDQLVSLPGQGRMLVRRVEAWVEIDGEERLVVFMTNNLAWSPRSVCDLYRRRWEIEVFFKQVKQTLKLSNFLGHSANAVRWQVYAALLIYVLLRYRAHVSNWAHSFTRIFTVVRSALWERLDLGALLASYGTASPPPRMLANLHEAWLPGLSWKTV